MTTVFSEDTTTKTTTNLGASNATTTVLKGFSTFELIIIAYTNPRLSLCSAGVFLHTYCILIIASTYVLAIIGIYSNYVVNWILDHLTVNIWALAMLGKI